MAAHHIILSLVYSRKKLLTTSHLRWLIMFLLLAITVYTVYSMDLRIYIYIYIYIYATICSGSKNDYVMASEK